MLPGSCSCGGLIAIVIAFSGQAEPAADFDAETSDLSQRHRESRRLECETPDRRVVGSRGTGGTGGRLRMSHDPAFTAINLVLA
jgi:hypothetical protein